MYRLHFCDTLFYFQLFCHSLVANVNRSRQLLQQKQRQQQMQQIPEREDSMSSEPHITRAHQVACDILNLSQSELQDLMDGRSRQEAPVKVRSRSWIIDLPMGY